MSKRNANIARIKNLTRIASLSQNFLVTILRKKVKWKLLAEMYRRNSKL